MRYSAVMFTNVALVVLGCFGQENPVPCANCNGVWTDNYGNVWSLDTNWSIGDTAIQGTVAAVPPGPGCPFSVINYSVSGSLTRIPGTGGTSGQTNFVVTAINPGQQSTENCLIATNTQYSGSIHNGVGGCRSGGGTWSNSFGWTDSFTWSKNCLMPDGNPTESSFSMGWNDAGGLPTIHLWRAQVGASSNFGGRTVEERQASFGAYDNCHFTGSPYSGGCPNRS